MIFNILVYWQMSLYRCYSSNSLEQARQALQNGHYYEALSFYDTAISENDINHIAYYLRGALNELLRRYPQAINDYTNCIKIKADFYKAQLSRAHLRTKQGQLTEAQEDLHILTKIIDKEISDEASELLQKVKETQKTLGTIDAWVKEKKYKEAFEHSNTIIDFLTCSLDLRSKRVDILEHLPPSAELLTELSTLSSLIPNDLDLIQKIAHVHFISGNIEEATKQIRRCLKSDPDHSSCKSLFRKQKKYNKLVETIEESLKNNDFKSVVEKSNKLVTEFADSTHSIAIGNSYICRAQYQLRKYEDSQKACTIALKIHPEDIEARLTRAELYIMKEMFDEAKSEFNLILEKHKHHPRATDGMNRIEKILKNKGRRNYYKILNVSRTATKHQIEKAYREMVRKWHPDHFREEEKIKEANKMLHEINDARSVLVDEEKRRHFDSGGDPLDPQEQSQRSSQHSQGSQYSDQGSFFNFFKGGNPFGGDGQGGNFRFTFG